MKRNLRAFIVAVAFVLGTLETQRAQVTNKPEPRVEQHIRDLEAELPAESTLRRQLLIGGRGDGRRQPWMDDMRKEGVKKAVVEVSIDFNRHGRPKRMVVKSMKFYSDYDGRMPVSDAVKLNKIRSSGLEQELRDIALQRAAQGGWVDVPRPRPKPFDGGATLEFFEDEWLPTPGGPLYCAGKSCFSSSEGKVDNLN